MTTADYLVDDLHSFVAAGRPKGRLWSCSTGLPFLVDQPVESPEALISQGDYDRLGKAVLKAMPALQDGLIELANADTRFAGAATALTSNFYYAFLSFAYKALVLAAWVAAVKDDRFRVIGCPTLRPVDGLSAQPGRHDHMFAAFEEAFPEQMVAVPPVDPGAFQESFAHVPRFDRLFNILNRSNGALAFQIWRRLGRPRLPARSGTLLIPVGSDAIEEAFPLLCAEGWHLVPVEVSPRAAPAPSDLANVEARFRACWAGLFAARARGETDRAGPIMETAGRLLWSRIADVLNRYPNARSRVEGQVDQWRRRFGGDALAVLSSGLYSPVQRIMDQACRHADIPVICLDHGASKGLGLRHDYTAEAAISFSDYYLAYNEQTRHLYHRHRRSGDQEIIVAGAPKIVRQVRFPEVQRRLARRYLGVNRDEPLLIYVTSLAANNVPQGYGTATDHVYAAFQMGLINCLGAFPGRVVVKPYPAHRYGDPEQIWQLPLPANAKRAPFGEFRHIRWAADAILLDLCSSTLGWALAPDKPVIYVDNVSNPLTDHARARAREALLLIDAHQAGWEQALTDRLATGLPEMEREWAEKASARREFDRDYVLGPADQLRPALKKGLSAAFAKSAVTGPTGVHDVDDRRIANG